MRRRLRPSRPSPRWIQTWGASPAPSLTVATVNPRSLTPSFENQTLVQLVRVSAGGARVRVRFSNELGAKPLLIGGASVTLLSAAGEAVGGARRLTFSGLPTVSVPSGAPMLSDPVDMPVAPLAKLQVALFLPQPVLTCTCHLTGAQHAFISPPGDYTMRPFDRAAGASTTYRAFLTGVDVETAARGPVIVALGDSITDGYRSTDDTDRRWPDRLAERLHATAAGRAVAVVNAGISGNRVLADGKLVIAGQSALTRFDRDVLAVPGATHLIILEGVNDLGVGAAAPPSAAEMIGGYRQLIARAAEHGLTVIGATILPYEGAAYFNPKGEAVRQEINRWIRTSGEFAHVVDFDAAARDPAQPSRLRADLQSGDWLHPNDAGYRVMGDAVDLAFVTSPQHGEGRRGRSAK